MRYRHTVDVDDNGRTVDRNNVRLRRKYPAKVDEVRAGNRLALPRRIQGAKGQNRSGVVGRDRSSAEIGREPSGISRDGVEFVGSFPQRLAASAGQIIS